MPSTRSTATPDSAHLLAAYDSQLRGEPEMVGATDVTVDGPLFRGIFDRGGFVGYRDLDGLEGASLDALIARTVSFYRDATNVEEFEWKTRGHDAPADLGTRLLAAGFQSDPEETVMIGEASALAVPVEIPTAVTLRRLDAGSETFIADVHGMAAMQIGVFGDGPDGEQLLRRLNEPGDRAEAWVAEADDVIICGGLLEVVAGTEFAGLWGGSTSEAWRGRGIYRALVSARARSAIERGVRYLQSDCTPMSQPILERSGLSRVTTTTPFMWRRSTQGG